MNQGKPAILCVDDEEANLKLLENMLVPRGYDVISAASGEDAMLKVSSQAIDLVLLDVMMPGMDGFEVCRRIKEDARLRDIPVIMITALTARQDRIRGIEAGAEEFLTKPIDKTEAFARIKILLKLKELSDERSRAEEALQRSHDELDRKVRERTAELARGNASLQAEIIERRLAEENVKNSLAEKEILLKEVHHRVKNNLMILIGLIQMQERKSDIIKSKMLLLDLKGRVHAMALVHESLHRAKDLAHVNLQEYIETLGAQIHAQFGLEREIQVQATGIDVSLDIAVPMGLILNELITNAYQHAFPGDPTCPRECPCEINVKVKNESGLLTLAVGDNGIGLPVGLDWKKSDTLGMNLIQMLSQQLNGTIALDRTHGTNFQLRFAHTHAAS